MFILFWINIILLVNNVCHQICLDWSEAYSLHTYQISCCRIMISICVKYLSWFQLLSFLQMQKSMFSVKQTANLLQKKKWTLCDLPLSFHHYKSWHSPVFHLPSSVISCIARSKQHTRFHVFSYCHWRYLVCLGQICTAKLQMCYLYCSVWC